MCPDAVRLKAERLPDPLHGNGACAGTTSPAGWWARWCRIPACQFDLISGGRRYAEHPEFSGLPGLGNLDSPQRGGPVGPLLQVLGDVVKEGFHPRGLDVVDADAVDTGSPSVFPDFAPGPGKHVSAGDLVVAGMESAQRVLLG